jgi:DNA-binding transcriptional ArsR family regulator
MAARRPKVWWTRGLEVMPDDCHEYSTFTNKGLWTITGIDLCNLLLVKRGIMNTQSALKALSEPRRRELLELLRDEGAQSVGALAGRVDITQQAVSLHLKVLEEAGLVEARREGTKHIYAVKPEGFRPIQEFVAGFWTERLGVLNHKLDRK